MIEEIMFVEDEQWWLPRSKQTTTLPGKAGVSAEGKETVRESTNPQSYT
jgi:hypothetical protein